MNFLFFLSKSKKNLSTDSMLSISMTDTRNLRKFKIKKKYLNKCNNALLDPILIKTKSRGLTQPPGTIHPGILQNPFLDIKRQSKG